MKFLILFTFLFCNFAHAQLSNTQREEVYPRNLLTNPGFESGKAGWSFTTTADVTIMSDGTGPMGKNYARWASGAANRVFAQSLKVSHLEAGRNGVFSCDIRVPSGNATHIMYIEGPGGTPQYVKAKAITSNSTTVSTTHNFVFPSQGSSVNFGMYSDSASEPSIDVISCFVGLAEGFNVGSVSQATFVGGIEQVGASGCNYSENTSTALTDFDALGSGSGCNSWTASGDITATGTNEHSAVYNNMPPGNYDIKLSGGFESQTSGSCLFALSDGTSTYQPQLVAAGGAIGAPLLNYSVSYTASGSRTFSLVVADNQASGCQIRNDNAGRNLSWKFYRFPLSSEQAYKPDLTAQSWSGYHDNTCSFAVTSTTYADYAADASCAFAERQNTNFGTVTSALSGSDKLPGITFTPKREMKYFVCASSSVNSSSNTIPSIRITDGTTAFSEWSSRMQTNNGSEGIPFNLCGIYSATSTNEVTLKLQGLVATGSNTVRRAIANSSIEWSIFALDQSFPAPLIVNSVVTSAKAVWAHESAFVSSADAVSRESGDWINGDCTNATTGKATCNINSGVFSDVPNCTCTAFTNGASSKENDCFIQTATSSQLVIATTNDNTPSNLHFTLMCHGPR